FAAANSITLISGVMYENTTENKFRIYDGAAWGDYDATAQASQTAAALSATNAASSASAAAGSATAAATSATNAANSATSASGSASTATSQATNAAASATSAAASATAQNGVLTVSAVGSPTLTAPQAANGIHVYTGALSADSTVTLPMTSHPFIAENNTTGGFSLTIAATGGVAQIVMPQGTMELFCDGS